MITEAITLITPSEMKVRNGYVVMIPWSSKKNKKNFVLPVVNSQFLDRNRYYVFEPVMITLSVMSPFLHNFLTEFCSKISAWILTEIVRI